MAIAALNFNIHVCQNSMDETIPQYIYMSTSMAFSILMFERYLYNIISFDSQLSNDIIRGEIIISIL